MKLHTSKSSLNNFKKLIKVCVLNNVKMKTPHYSSHRLCNVPQFCI